MDRIEQTIETVERLYQTLTGHEPPESKDTPYAAIPPERNPIQVVEEGLERLAAMLTLTPPELLGSQAARGFTPAVCIWEADRELIVQVDLPGITRSQVKVQVSDGALVVTGQRTAPEQNGHRPALIERPLGQFHRAIPLPAGALTDQLTAKVKDGVLEVRIPQVVHPNQSVQVG